MKNMMKMTVLMVTAVLFLAPSVSKAQIHFGVRAGLNASNISFKNLPNKGEKFGFHAGIFTEIPLMPDFMTLQPELSYSSKGTTFKPATTKQTLSMNYVDLFLPVAFKLNMFDLQVGPFVSYMITTPDYTYYGDNKIYADAFKKFDVGLTGGLSANFDKIIVGVRYNQGFMDITKDNGRALLGSGKNAVGQVSVGYKF